MQRWHLTLGLVGCFSLAALLVPQLRGPQGPSTGEGVTPPSPVVTPTVTSTVATPQQRGALTVTAGLDRPALLEGKTEERLLVITLTADELEGDVERPVNVAVVIDRSGSMAARGKMEYAREAALELVQSLDERDRFSLVAFSDRAETLVASTPAVDRAALRRSILGLNYGGGTNLYGGLDAGLSQVFQHADDAQVNRVIVLSDGLANIGVTDPAELLRAAGRRAEQGVTVSTIGLGLDFNEDLLAEMADAGGGTYRFVDDPSQLQAIFQEELHQMTAVAARGVAVDIDLQGAELIEVYGYDAEAQRGQLRVWLGDVYGGQTRKIVAKVRVPAGRAGDTPAIAEVQVTEQSDDNVGYDAIPVAASVTHDRAVVERTANAELAVMGNAAVSSAFADEAARAYERGEREKSVELLNSARLVAGETASRYDAPMARAQAADLEVQQDNYARFDNGSEDGKREIKKNKEQSRAWSK